VASFVGAATSRRCGGIDDDSVVLVDTSVWIDYFNGALSAQTDHLDTLLGSGTIMTGDLILTEVLQGFVRDAQFRRAQTLLDEIPCADLVGRNVALQAAENFRALRRHGVTVRKTIDVMIGTFCIVHDHELLHADRDFDAMARYLGLRVAASRAP
jgi:predicted nucleic acid-binding protein